MRKVIFVDVDGTILKHQYPEFGFAEPVILEGVKEAFKSWSSKDYHIIITTGRKESMRESTINQLKKLQLSYDLLLMGMPRGERVIINDMKPDGTITARAFNIERDKGFDEDIINL
jgi:hypothetical protein